MRFGRTLELGLSDPVPQSEADKVMAKLQQWDEQRAKERLKKKFAQREERIDRALSDNPEEAYRDSFLKPLKGDSWLYVRLGELIDTLALMEEFKDRLPERYQATINKIRERAEDIKKIFQDYRQLREKGEGRGFHDTEVLANAIRTLGKIDPERFPPELIDFSEEELRHLDHMSHLVLRKEEPDRQDDSVTPSR